MMNFHSDIKRIANLRTYGHLGILLCDDKEIFNSAKNNPHELARWHMPVQALVNGDDVGRQGMRHNSDNMFNYREKGKLAGSFGSENNGESPIYMTATKMRASHLFLIGVNALDGQAIVMGGRENCASRPVRAVLRPAA
jgi:hypothetical protein